MAEFLNTAFYSFDIRIFEAVGELQSASLNGFMHFISFFGSSKAFLLYLLLLIFLTAVGKTRRLAFPVLFSLLIGVLLTNICLKNLVARPRPYSGLECSDFWPVYERLRAFAGNVSENSYSFPSGHASMSFTLSLSLGLTARREAEIRQRRRALLIFAVLLLSASLIAFSRIYLMVHYPTDVIGGIAVGIFSGTVGVRAAEPFRDFLRRIPQAFKAAFL